MGKSFFCVLGVRSAGGSCGPAPRRPSWRRVANRLRASGAMFFGTPGGLVGEPAGMTSSAVHITCDTVSERLRRWTRNQLGSARRGSNPFGVVLRPNPGFSPRPPGGLGARDVAREGDGKGRNPWRGPTPDPNTRAGIEVQGHPPLG